MDFSAFLSYSWAERELAHRIHAELLAAGFDVWIDKEQIRTGDRLPTRLRDQIAQTRIFVALISDAYARSKWCRAELDAATKFEGKVGYPRILPLKLDSTDPETLIPERAWCDFRPESDFAKQIGDLKRAMHWVISTASGEVQYDRFLTRTVWSPGRERDWRVCRKLYWYNNVAPRLRYLLERGDQAKLELFRTSRSIRSLAGSLLHREIRIDMDWPARDPEKVLPRWKKLAAKELKKVPAKVIEQRNGVSVEPMLSRSLEQGIHRLIAWRSLNIQHLERRKVRFRFQRSTARATLDLSCRPIATKMGGSEIVLLFSTHASETGRRARRLFYVSCLASPDIVSACTVVGLAPTTMYRFTRRTEEERDLLNQLNARADAFHEEVLSKPIVADASKGICRFCTYLRVCAEGQKVVFGSVGDSIPQASIQRSIPGF